MLLFAVVTGLCAPLAARMKLDASFVALLPESAPAARDLEATRDRIGGTSTLMVIISAPSDVRDRLETLAPRLAERLYALGDLGVSRVDYSRGDYKEFVAKHRYAFLDLAKVKEIHEALEERIASEKAKANPLYVSLEDDDGKLDALLEELAQRNAELDGETDGDKSPYFIHPDGSLLVLFVRSELAAGDAASIDRLTTAVDVAFKEVQVEAGMAEAMPPLELGFGGDLTSARAEHTALAGELIMASSITLALVLALMLFYFRSLRVPVVLVLMLLPALTATFALGTITIGSLNIASAFLASIIIGNGINPALIWLSRYFESRREGRPFADTVPETHRAVFKATFVASLAAGLAYFALTVTDFRGFRDFGILGGTGIVLTWIATVLLLPSLLAISERLAPMRIEKRQVKLRKNRFGRLTMPLVERAPKTVGVVCALLGFLSLGLAGYAMGHDPIEYDFSKLSSNQRAATSVILLNRRVSEFMPPTAAGNAIALLTETPEDALYMQQTLDAARDAGNGAYSRVNGIYSLLPRDVPEKEQLYRDIRDQLVTLRTYVDEDEQRRIDELEPPENLARLELSEVPLEVARPFIERDGTRGRILYIERSDDVSIWDGRYLIAWANSIRAIALPDGSRPPLAGRAPIFADMLESVWRDGPIAILCSLGFTVLLLLFAFRRWSERIVALLTLLLGIVWLAGLMVIGRMRLNFLNFLAYPITFGNGADYGVNILRRYVDELKEADPHDAIERAISRSGGAVLLCSLTTIIGYGALASSANQAVRSFGIAMALSEVTCFLAAALAMPAWLIWRQPRSAPRPAKNAVESPAPA